jgi:LysR family glycine cleavage system transcriptional activator
MLYNMARLPLHTLPAFRAVARLQNLRAAADELHLTHSAISQQIKQLEDTESACCCSTAWPRLRINAAGRALQRRWKRRCSSWTTACVPPPAWPRTPARRSG